MKKEELDRLLEKYYKGESIEEDEKALRAFFSKNSIPEGYEAENAIFSYYMGASEIPEPSADFEAKILTGIDKSVSRSRLRRFRKFILPSLSTAAGILIVVASWFLFTHRNDPRDTYTNPELAYAETMKILVGVSSQLNQGARALEPFSKMNELTTKIVKKNLKNLGNFQKAIEIANMPVEKNINKNP